jgi:DNA repair protein RadA/Sms
MRLSSETELAPIVDFVTSQPPGLLVVDSIQSVHDVGLESVPGSVGQVRECALQLTRVAKEHRVATLLIGHVTKEGAIAGPKVVEHIVDAVLYLEGERFQSYRLLRGVKNRFGATNEVGVFEMRDGGFAEVPDPSAAFLSDRVDGSPGSTVVVAMEGTRPLLVEVQALVTRTSFSMPRRVASGIDFNRIVLLIAILAKRGGVALHESDIHVNVVGGLHIEETAVDLGVALAVLSSHRDVALCAETVVIGELGLAGEVRGVGQTAARLREAAKLGFRRAIVPASSAHAESEVSGIEIIPVRTLREAARLAGVQ